MTYEHTVINYFHITEVVIMIGTAVQRGSFVYVYDEKGRQTACIPAKKGLVGYGGNSVSVTDGHFNYIYDERGRQTGCVPAR